MDNTTTAQQLQNLHIGNLVGDLSVEGTEDESTHRVRGATGRARFDNGTLHLGNALSDCSLVVPSTTNVQIGTVAGDADLQNLGDIDIATVSGDLSVQTAKSLDLRTVGGDCTLHTIASAVSARSMGGDFEAQHIEGSLDLRSIGGDVDCQHIGGRAEIRSIGGDLHCEDIEGQLTIHAIGGDVHCQTIEGNLNIRAVGGDVLLAEVDGDAIVEKIGGDLDLKLEFQAENTYQFSAKGVVTIMVDDDTNATFNLPAGVPLEFEGFDVDPSINTHQLTLGTGAATVTILADEEDGTKEIVFQRT